MANIYDFMSLEDKEKVDAIVARAVEAKKNAPKAPRGPRGPLTQEQIDKRATTSYGNLAAKLKALRAGA